jgi:hypothetical protein
VQIPILNGMFTDGSADFRSSYPVNLIPTVVDSGISKGYLRPADGLVSLGDGPGHNRGGINWNGVCYRVMGTKFVSISSAGVVTTLGAVGEGGPVTFDYSFDRLAINSGDNLFYWDGAALSQVTDGDLGVVIDVVWIDGYFMTTDGEFLVVTELSDPTQVSPLKYGSSEADPDPVERLLKISNEVYALNRNTIEVFDNIGGDLFPFQRIEGAQIQKGTLGTRCSTEFLGAVAFLGSGRNEAPAIYLGLAGQVNKISSAEIDILLKTYTEAELSGTVMESMVDKGRSLLYLHLPDRTIVYDSEGSKMVGEPVWFVLTSSVEGFSQYKAKHFVWCYDKWLCGDPTTSSYGYLTDTASDHYGVKVRWEFGTQIVYNEGKGIIFHQLELVALTGRTALNVDPYISTSYSSDGRLWSQPKSIKSGKIGENWKRLVWLQLGFMRNWRIQRFSGDSDSFLSFARLEAEIEGLTS